LLVTAAEAALLVLSNSPAFSRFNYPQIHAQVIGAGLTKM
jgi:hypothetical protein